MFENLTKIHLCKKELILILIHYTLHFEKLKNKRKIDKKKTSSSEI